MRQTGDRLRGHTIALLTSIPNPSCSVGSSVMWEEWWGRQAEGEVATGPCCEGERERVL